jgi:Thioesterase domain
VDFCYSSLLKYWDLPDRPIADLCTDAGPIPSPFPPADRVYRDPSSDVGRPGNMPTICPYFSHGKMEMILFTRLSVVAAVYGALCFGAIDTPAAAQTAKQKTATAAEVQVDLLRGLADIFSRGMDTLTEKLNRQGYSARVYSTNGWQTVARRIADKYSRSHKDIIVLIGHSLGGNAALQIANDLDRSNIPIELVITFDATEPSLVPKNVLHLVNFYQNNGFGKKISPGAGFKGELTNVDLTADANIRHVTIDKSDRLHAYVVEKIAEIVKKDLASKIPASKPKTRKAQNSR